MVIVGRAGNGNLPLMVKNCCNASSIFSIFFKSFLTCGLVALYAPNVAPAIVPIIATVIAVSNNPKAKLLLVLL